MNGCGFGYQICIVLHILVTGLSTKGKRCSSHTQGRIVLSKSQGLLEVFGVRTIYHSCELCGEFSLS